MIIVVSNNSTHAYTYLCINILYNITKFINIGVIIAKI